MNNINILRKATELGLSWCFLRDEKSVNSVIENNQGDLDILITPEHEEKFKTYLSENKFYNYGKGNMFIKFDESITIDVHCEPYTRLPFLTFEYLENKIVKKNNLNFPNYSVLVQIYLLHPMDIFGIKGFRPITNLKHDYILKYGDNFLQKNLTDTLINKSYLKNMLNKLILLNDIKSFNDYYIKISKKIKINYWSNLSSISLLFSRHVVSRFRSEFKKTKILSVTGVDGSGKTTLINEVSNEYKRHNLKVKVLYFGALGSFFLPIKWLFYLKKIFISKKNKVEKSSNNKTESNVSKYLQFFLFFEYSFRSLVILYYRLCNVDIIILDRHWIDLLRSDINFQLLFKFRKLVNADKIFMIKGDTKEFYSRKGEYSPHILKQHQQTLESSLHKYYSGNFKIITDKTTNIRLDNLMSSVL